MKSRILLHEKGKNSPTEIVWEGKTEDDGCRARAIEISNRYLRHRAVSIEYFATTGWTFGYLGWVRHTTILTFSESQIDQEKINREQKEKTEQLNADAIRHYEEKEAKKKIRKSNVKSLTPTKTNAADVVGH